MSDSRVIVDKSNIEKELTLIEYPGLVKNDEKMLETLGGLPKVSQVICGEKRRLELKFHPNSVYNRPACGDIHQNAGLLLKVKVRKNKNKTDEPPTHVVEVMGRCRRAIKFDSLCDYQYLPILKNEESGKAEYIYDKVVPSGIPDQEWWSEIDKPLFCAPGIFARSDSVPTSTIYRQEQKVNQNPDILDITRTKQIETAQFQTFNLTDHFPTTPHPDVVKRMTVKYVSDSQLENVNKLFEDCPIWNRISLVHESGLSNDKIKSILPSVAYYFTSGPWRTFYVRLGYDPRKDFESRYYQMIDFRVKCRPGITEHIKVKAKARQDANRTESQQATASTSRQQSKPVKQDISYPYFEEGRLPRGRQCIYRYCDLKLPKIIEMLEKIPTPLSGATCNEKTGWLPPGFDDQCRQIMTACVREQLKKARQHSESGEGDEEMEEDELTEDDEGNEMDEDLEQLLEDIEDEENE